MSTAAQIPGPIEARAAGIEISVAAQAGNGSPVIAQLVWHHLRAFHARASDLIVGYVIQVREPTFWERYRWRVAGVMGLLILQTALIAALLSQRSKSWRATRNLAESEERNRAIFQAIPDLMILQTAEGIYLDYHAKDPASLLVKPQDFLGKSMFEIFPTELANTFRSRFKRALETGETQVCEYEIDSGGETQWFEARIAPCSNSRILSVVRDITERKQAAKALELSEEFNRRIVESSSDCVKVLDLEGSVIYMSERGQRLLEVDQLGQLIGTSWIGLWSGEDRIQAQKAFECARNGGIGSFRGFGKTLKGTDKWWHTVISPIQGTLGTTERLLAVSRDVTEQELAVTALQQSEERFGKAFRANPQPMSLTSFTEGRFLDVNESFLSMSGYTRNEVIGHSVDELKIYERPNERVSLLIEPLSKSGVVRNFELRFRTKNGAVKVLLSSAELIELGGEQCILVASSDISDRIALEENLRLSEREFSTLVQNSPDIISRLDQDLRYIYISPKFEKVTGVQTEMFIGKTPSELPLPDYDWRTVEESCREAILKRTPSHRAFEYRGRNYWTRVIPEFSPDGQVESVMTISEDVTDRLRSERELTQLTVRLFNLQDEERRRIARELHDGTAQNLFAISVNLAKLKQLGFTVSEEVGQLVAECESLSDQSVQEIRTLSYLLHPPLLDHAGLVSALQWYVEGFTKRSGIYVDVLAQPIGRLRTDVEMALFRVVQEALTNVRRHSGSETASIRLERKNGEVKLEIRDRGQGLSNTELRDDQSEVDSMGVGIPGMRQRLKQLGGRLEITSHEHGTTISAVVPITNGASYGANSSGG